MDSDQSAPTETYRGARLAFGELYPVLAFYVLYAVVIGLYDALQPFTPLPSYEAGWIMLVTSPFNYAEAVGKTTAETTQGLYNNFTFVAVLMVISMLYNIFVSRRLRRYVSVPSIFGASVCATYVVSWGVWKISAYPATGTSIIGFSFAFALAATAFADLVEHRKLDLTARRSIRSITGILLCSFVLAFALVTVFSSYLWGNSSYFLHLAGGGIAFVALYLWTELGNPSLRALPKALVSGPSSAVLFVLVVTVVVLLA